MSRAAMSRAALSRAVLSRAALTLALAALAAGCGPSADHFAIRIKLTQGDEYRCPSPVCSGIEISCSAVVSVRVVDASDPSTVYVSKCLPLDHATNLCGLGAVDLGTSNPVPNRMVRVEVLVWPRVEVPDLVCPTDVGFDARNMPLGLEPAPAIGGQTYFRAGDGDVAEVELGCIDIASLNNAACSAPGTVQVSATVDDFDTGVALPGPIAEGILVGVGEPRARTNPDTQQIEWELLPSDLTSLPPAQVSGPIPAWRNDMVPTSFQRAACVQVLEVGPQETPAITCHAATKDALRLDLHAFRLTKATLAQAFNVLRLPGVPDQGLVVGMVVDHNGNPQAGATVIPSAGHISFVSADRSMVDLGSVTTASGMFVSSDVPFDATWTASDGHGGTPVEKTLVGGLVVGKATVVFIQFDQPASTQ